MTLDELSGYPCANDFSALKGMCCFGDDCYMDDCVMLPIYRAHIALRKAVLGDMTAAEAARMYRDIAKREYRYEARDGYKYHEEQDRFNALADIVADL
jgi:hypothetical protein